MKKRPRKGETKKREDLHPGHLDINAYSTHMPDKTFLSYEPQYRSYRVSLQKDDGKIEGIGERINQDDVLRWTDRASTFGAAARFRVRGFRIKREES